jgi:DUF4097 and DUF4098 domain-containing protein YvlB
MNKLTLQVSGVFLGVLLASPSLARDVDQTQDASADGKVEIFNLAGEIIIVGWDRSEIQVSGDIGDDAEDFIFERSGNLTTIKVKVPDRHHGHVDVSSDLLIRVPKGSSIDVSGVSSDISSKGVEGEQDLQSVSGDIETQIFGSDVDAETVSGDVVAEGSNKDNESKLESVSGDVTAENLAGEIKAGSVSGDLEITNGSFSRAKIETVNGDITHEAALQSGGKLEIETVNGSVDVMFVGTVSAEFEIETFNGRIRNCFGPDAERTSKYAPGWELSFTEGGGEGRVSIATLNGGLRLCKE